MSNNYRQDEYNNFNQYSSFERNVRKTSNQHRQKSSSDVSSIVRILVSFVVIVISIIAIVIVVRRVQDIKIFDKINLKPETHDSLNITTDDNLGNSFFVNDEKGIKFRKEDKSFAREEWIEKNGELFYFDTAGYGLNGDLKLEGQVYSFENGKLKNIKRDTTYVRRAKDEYFSSIESAQYLVWLSDDEKVGSFYPIKYKMFSDDTEDYLGTEADMQYASPNMIKIYMSNIYYLAVGKGTNYAGRLYRMRPNAIHKETIGIGVTGFIVLSDDVVYYCDGDRVMKVKSWNNINLKLKDNEELTEDGEIIIKFPTPSDATFNINDTNNNIDEAKVDINELPKPDEEVKIEETSVDSEKRNVLTPPFETGRRSTGEANNIRKENETTVRNNEPRVEIGLSPGETRKETSNNQVEIGAEPKVVEVEAPR